MERVNAAAAVMIGWAIGLLKDREWGEAARTCECLVQLNLDDEDDFKNLENAAIVLRDKDRTHGAVSNILDQLSKMLGRYLPSQAAPSEGGFPAPVVEAYENMAEVCKGHQVAHLAVIYQDTGGGNWRSRYSRSSPGGETTLRILKEAARACAQGTDMAHVLLGACALVGR